MRIQKALLLLAVPRIAVSETLYRSKKAFSFQVQAKLKALRVQLLSCLSHRAQFRRVILVCPV